MASTERPILVICPGAFGKSDGFDKLIPHLNGLETHPGAYPSCNHPDPTTATCADDISSFRKTLLSLLEKRNVVILAHSFGGVVAGGAAKDLDVDTRKSQGHATAVVGLIYVVGNITLKGESLFDAVGGAYPPFIKYQATKGWVLIEPAMDVLFNDCEYDPELVASVYPHAHNAFETKASAPAWQDKGFDGRRTYIRTLQDNCNPTALQDIWINKSGVTWDVFNFDTGHMPFVSKPEPLGAQIVKSIDKFMEL
ncbi:Alpha/Beta hydrolase protein [Astrocystis sublimbata]|nr:Alpha/Beta hydrolase protein [Astrocystis sublimbata]